MTVGINERRRSPNKSEFRKDAQQVKVDKFVSFAERLRSLSCLVDWFHSFHSLLKNIALKCKNRVLFIGR